MSVRSGKQANGITPHEKSTKNGKLEANGYLYPTTPKGYLPFSHNVLTPEMEEYARTHLNETEETRKKALQEMRDILKSDPDLVFSDEELILLCYLRCKKFDVKRAVEFFKTGVHYIDTYRQGLERKDPNVVRRVIDTNLIGLLPYRDPQGRAIMYILAENWKPSEIPAIDVIFASVISIQSAGHNPVTQVNGFLVVLDLKGLTIQQVLKFSRYLIIGTIMFQRSLPVFMKAFHVINLPPFYTLAWKLVKPLLSEKIKKRFIFHKSSDLSSLYEHIPKEILPLELGGSYEFSNKHWSWDLDNIEKEFYYRLDNLYFKSKRKNVSSLN